MKLTKIPLKLIFKFSIIIMALTGLFLRLHAINFGLPHSFHADEPEIVELAIKYTYEIRGIIKEGNYFKLIPISFVYGRFPTYLLTFATMSFSKFLGILEISFKKEVIYIFLRIITALTSLFLLPCCFLIYKKIFKKKLSKIEILGLIFLIFFNWKLIVHSHYVNMDLYLTVVLNLTFLSIIMYYLNPKKSLFVLMSGLLFGFAVGTKITAVLSLPWFVYIFLRRKDYRSLIAFLFLTYIGFAISNPFSLIFLQDFAYRIYQMQAKEAGMVFDSVNSNPFKYLKSLIFISTPIIFLLSLYGNLSSFFQYREETKKENLKPLHVFLTGNIITYLAFFSLNAREVSRWLLPILPIVLIYSTRGISLITEGESKLLQAFEKKYKKTLLIKIILGATIVTGIISYLYYPLLLLKQFNRHTPKSAAYIWLRENTSPKTNKLAITEEGLDPINKLKNSTTFNPEVYTTANAQFDFPPDPRHFTYVILASKPMANFKRKEVKEKYPFYSEKWQKFESTVENPENFTLIKEFSLPKPNLVNLSDVYIYENKSR